MGEHGQGLEEARLLVVDFVAMHVHRQVVALGQVDGLVQRLDAQLAGEFEMRDRPHHVGAQAQRLLQQFQAVGVGENALLGEGDDLQVDPGRHFAAHLEHGLERGEGRVGDVDVAAHVLHAVGDLPFQGLPGALLDVLVAEQSLALGPALDAFEQRAGAVPLRLAGGLGGVEMDVRLDERRHGKTAGAVQALAGVVDGLFHRHQGGDTAIGDTQLPETFAAAQAQVVNQHGGPLLVCSGCGSAGD